MNRRVLAAVALFVLVVTLASGKITKPGNPPCTLCPLMSTMNALSSEFQDQGALGDWCDRAGAALDDGTAAYQACLANPSADPKCPEYIEVFEQLFNSWWNNC